MRRAAFRLSAVAPDQPVRLSDEATAQFRRLVDDEARGRYLQGLKRLNARNRRLLVGRAELASPSPGSKAGRLTGRRPDPREP